MLFARDLLKLLLPRLMLDTDTSREVVTKVIMRYHLLSVTGQPQRLKEDWMSGLNQRFTKPSVY